MIKPSTFLRIFQKKYLPIYGIFATLSAFSFLLLSQPADGSLKKTYTSFDCFCTDLFRESITSNTINLHYTLANPASYGIKDYKVSLGSIGKKAMSGRFWNWKTQTTSYPVFPGSSCPFPSR